MPAVVIGVGNPFRGDDGVGHRVVEALAGEVGDAAACVLSDGEPTRLLEQWAGSPLVVVVDALVTGAAPGTVSVFDPAVDGLPVGRATSSHASGVAEAWSLAGALGVRPERLLVVGVEVASVADGPGLSPAVEAAVAPAIDVVRGLVGAGGGGGGAAGRGAEG